MAPRRDPASRRAALRWGLQAEVVAAVFLSLKFYAVLARRYTAAGGEIDLVVRRGRTIAFVEVKARGDFGAAADAIGEEKRRRIMRAISRWCARNPWSESFVLRCDVVLVAPWRWPRHIVDALAMDD
ncbi:YraN family protein [uncultured Alsobacter sp.]|uniref:YraN family protein n=1 Tax=uncultured Alsobacter sp. TaxID=1748258 RepID=UPI0025E069E6|nr:YraN family protein [uncultured Alsobacter sp.]